MRGWPKGRSRLSVPARGAAWRRLGEPLSSNCRKPPIAVRQAQAIRQIHSSSWTRRCCCSARPCRSMPCWMMRAAARAGSSSRCGTPGAWSHTWSATWSCTARRLPVPGVRHPRQLRRRRSRRPGRRADGRRLSGRRRRAWVVWCRASGRAACTPGPRPALGPVNAGTGRRSTRRSPMRYADRVPCRSTPGTPWRGLEVLEAAQRSAATRQVVALGPGDALE